MKIDAKTKGYIIEFCDAQLEKESQAELQKTIVETAADHADVDKATFKDIASLYYLRTYKPESYAKAQAKAELLEIVEGI